MDWIYKPSTNARILTGYARDRDGVVWRIRIDRTEPGQVRTSTDRIGPGSHPVVRELLRLEFDDDPRYSRYWLPEPSEGRA